MADEFRFSTRTEYENEMQKILSFKSRPKRRKGEELQGYDLSALDEEYDRLVDEYLKFCAKDDA